MGYIAIVTCPASCEASVGAIRNRCFQSSATSGVAVSDKLLAGKVSTVLQPALHQAAAQAASTPADLPRRLELSAREILRNPAPARLYEHALAREGAAILASGALAVFSGEKTGRSPRDKRIVSRAESATRVSWGSVNIPATPEGFLACRRLALEFLNAQPTLYLVDGFAGWDPAHRIKVRVVCARAYHALFMSNLLIRPTPSELRTFGEPDLVIINAGDQAADPRIEGVGSATSVMLDLERGELLILGTNYAGEMKKGVFTVINDTMPRRGVLSMHCSANIGAERDVSLFFGLSGTGKTTLSSDPRRPLIGDDEHCWSEEGVFNVEGGCYAKCLDLSEELEPQIFRAIRFGAVLENVPFDADSRAPDYRDRSITENTRACYPIEFIEGAVRPCAGGHARNIIFLTCDAFGVLPPVSRLSTAQAMYHFLSGYTAKIAGTEVGVAEPQATFSACFGAAFLVLHPARYADLLAAKIRRHGAHAWLVNTGWTGGPYGQGSRIKLAHTRAIIDAIHSGSLANSPVKTDPFFQLDVPTNCPGIPASLISPRDAWPDSQAYDRMAHRLTGLFRENFATFAQYASEEVRQAGPSV
jgi:phosphoenolpyruvate carboxykinase (ATP)